MNNVYAAARILAYLSIPIAFAAAWMTHIYVCFTTGAWGFLVAGALFFPVAVVHGFGHWFGFW